MATGLSNKLVGQTGEFLVCAELGRRGLIATPFAGNVPSFDVIATDGEMRSVPLQVKTSNGGSWQFSGDKLLVIDYDEETGQQDIRGIRDQSNPDLIHVFVWLGNNPGKDRYFVLTKQQFLEVVETHYRSYLTKHSGRRPQSPGSFHTAMRLADLEPFEGNWILIEERLSDTHS